MKTKAIAEMLHEQNLSTTGSITVDGPWGIPEIKDRQFPIFAGERTVQNLIGTATAKINGSLKFEIEIDESRLTDDVVGTFEVLMAFHVREK